MWDWLDSFVPSCGPLENAADAFLDAFLGWMPAIAPLAPRPHRAADGWHVLRWAQQSAVGMDAEHLLRRYGISVRSRYVSPDGTEAGCDVPAQQAKWAEYLLCRAGWAVTSPLVDARHGALLDKAQRHGASRPVGGGRIRRQGLTAKVYGWLDEFAGPGEATRERLQPRQERWERRRPAQSGQRRGGWLDWLVGLFTVRGDARKGERY